MMERAPQPVREMLALLRESGHAPYLVGRLRARPAARRRAGRLRHDERCAAGGGHGPLRRGRAPDRADARNGDARARRVCRRAHDRALRRSLPRQPSPRERALYKQHRRGPCPPRFYSERHRTRAGRTARRSLRRAGGSAFGRPALRRRSGAALCRGCAPHSAPAALRVRAGLFGRGKHGARRAGAEGRPARHRARACVRGAE